MKKRPYQYRQTAFCVNFIFAILTSNCENRNNVSAFSTEIQPSAFTLSSRLLRSNDKCASKSSTSFRRTNRLWYGDDSENQAKIYHYEEDVVNVMDELPVTTLKSMCKERGLSAHGTKYDLVLKLALRQLKAEDLAAGTLDLNGMTVPELRELKKSLGVKGTAPKKSDLVRLLTHSLS